jgi:hypothetical protein
MNGKGLTATEEAADDRPRPAQVEFVALDLARPAPSCRIVAPTALPTIIRPAKAVKFISTHGPFAQCLRSVRRPKSESYADAGGGRPSQLDTRCSSAHEHLRSCVATEKKAFQKI